MGEGLAHDKNLSFLENFVISGAAAIIAKTAAAPIERVKLLVQNQGEMLKTGRLKEPYKGVIDCTVKVFRNEGTCPFAPLKKNTTDSFIFKSMFVRLAFS